MRIAMAQVNPTVGDLEGNLKMAEWAVVRAADQGAQLVLLPELALSGYPPQDLVERPAFLQANLDAVSTLARVAGGLYVVVGYVGQAASPTGKSATNSLALLRDGHVLSRRDKTLLPTYDVFDEARYFQPAESNHPVAVNGVRLGMTICEDVWNDRTFWQRRLYEMDPVERLADDGIDLLVNIAASPFSVGKQVLRRAMLGAAARRHGVPLFYVNLVGGNDQLVFDGRSLAIDAQGRVIAEAAAFREDLIVVDTDAQACPDAPPDIAPDADVWQGLELGLADYARKCGFRHAVLALSGGVDSALTAAIAAGALGPENVTALYMPTTFSSEHSRIDAQAVAANLGIKLWQVSIEDLRTANERLLQPIFAGTERGTAEENIQARIRGNLVMAMANKFGYLPLATGNKSELAVGYCTVYGDMVGGLAVIGDVPKSMVYRLSRYANREREVIPASVLEKPPSAELKPDQTDQDTLPPYDMLDRILDLYVEENLEVDAIVERGFDRGTVVRILNMVDRAEFKRRQAPFTLRVTSRAFGPGRRLPVAQRWTRR